MHSIQSFPSEQDITIDNTCNQENYGYEHWKFPFFKITMTKYC